MSFKGKNKIESTRDLMNERIKYKLTGLFDGDKAIETNVVDFNFSERVYYVRVDTNYNSVFPNEESLTYSDHSFDPIKAPKCINFVADAFNAMSGYLAELVTKRRLVSTPDCFFFPLEAQRGWIRPNKLYSRHLTFLYDMFIRRYLMASSGRLNREMTDFKKYLQIFVDFVNYATDNGVPITRSGYITNLGTSHAVSGLVIEISKDSDK